jgi:hypothetical protein
MSSKDDAIVLVEAKEIMQALPIEAHSDHQLASAIVVSLRQGLDKHEVQIKALDLAHRRLEAKVDKGFQLANQEIQSIKQRAEIEAIHAQYTRQTANEARQEVAQLWRSLYEVQAVAKVADVKAEGAKDIAKSRTLDSSNPLYGMAFTAILIIFILSFFTRVERVPTLHPDRAVPANARG